MNVYNVVLTSIIVVFCDSLLSDRTTLNYLVVATLILTSTTTALCLLFLPKVSVAVKVIFVYKQFHMYLNLYPIPEIVPCCLETITRWRSNRSHLS